MYNFRMTKKQQDIILNECNLDEVQTYIFNKLVEGKKRKNVYELVKNKYGLSQPSTDRRIKKINNIIHCYNEEKENITLKVYMHIFPNGKKYVGVCQNCDDRWNNGRGYAFNEQMYNDIQKYSWDNIEHKILYETTNSEVAYQLEKILIEELDLKNKGYNRE